MKKIIAIMAAVLVCVAASAQDSRSIYNKYSDKPGVSAVFISNAMFRMIGRIPDIDLGNGDVNLAPIIKSLKGLYILNIDRNPALGATLKADTEKHVKAGRYEMLMEVKDDGETVRIYTVNKGDIITDFVMIASEADETTFISFEGEIPQNALEALLQ